MCNFILVNDILGFYDLNLFLQCLCTLHVLHLQSVDFFLMKFLHFLHFSTTLKAFLIVLKVIVTRDRVLLLLMDSSLGWLLLKNLLRMRPRVGISYVFVGLKTSSTLHYTNIIINYNSF